MIDFDKVKLDKEERELEDSFERGEWRSVKDLDAEIKRYQNYARSFSKRSDTASGERPSSEVASGPVTHRQ